MKPKFTDIYELIAKSFDGNITEEEKLILEEWKAESEANHKEYTDYRYLWENSKMLPFPSSIHLSHALAVTRLKANINNNRIRWIKFAAQAAAVLLLAVILSGIYTVFHTPEIPEIADVPVVYQEMKAAFGTQTSVNLPDGSAVYLNSGSAIRFPVSFSGLKERKVYLSGEGYFIVNSNPDNPFLVETDDLQIMATGTSFNVDAYDNNDAVTVALAEGELMLNRKTVQGKIDDLVIKPNHVARYNRIDNTLSWKQDEDLFKYTAWTEGKIVFVNDPIDLVMNKLSNWYNVEIILADRKLYSYRFTGTFINEPVEQVLSILNLTSSMRYTIQPAEKNGDNSYTKRKIILRSK